MTKHAASRKEISSIKRLPAKKQRYIKKLITRLSKLGTDEIVMPIDRSITEVIVLYKGDAPSWFHDIEKDECKLLIRIEGAIDDEGLGCHLTEEAKVFQWILWQPLLGENSKAHPERCWREENFATPGEFLASKVHGKYRGEIKRVCRGRWDTAMMMGGASSVEKLIDKHIRVDNLALRTCILTWTKGMKWHQDWDWESIAESSLLTKGHGLDVYWEGSDYLIPSSFKPVILWSNEQPDVMNNIRKALLALPPFKCLEDSEDSEAGLTQTTLTRFVDSSAKPTEPPKSKRKYNKTGSTEAIGVNEAVAALSFWSKFSDTDAESGGSRKRGLQGSRMPLKAKKPKAFKRSKGSSSSRSRARPRKRISKRSKSSRKTKRRHLSRSKRASRTRRRRSPRQSTSSKRKKSRSTRRSKKRSKKSKRPKKRSSSKSLKKKKKSKKKNKKKNKKSSRRKKSERTTARKLKRRSKSSKKARQKIRRRTLSRR